MTRSGDADETRAGPRRNDTADRDVSTAPGRRPVYNDLRDDYDDEFGGDRTPLGNARRRVLAPAVAFIVIGILVIVGALIGAIAAILDFLGTPGRSHHVIFLALLLALCSLGPIVAAIVIPGGVCLKNLRVAAWL